MEVVIIEKKTFEALLTDVATLMEKVNGLARMCNDRRLSNWLDGEDVCRAGQPPDCLFAGQSQVFLQAGRGGTGASACGVLPSQE